MFYQNLCHTPCLFGEPVLLAQRAIRGLWVLLMVVCFSGCQPSEGLYDVLEAWGFSFDGASDSGEGDDQNRPFAQAPASSQQFNFAWPPQVGQVYPEIPLLNAQGQNVKLSQFRGEVLLVMPIAMTSPGSQALAGGDLLGGLYGVVPQADVASIDHLIETFSALSPDDPRLVVVELLFYGPERTQALPEHINAWAAHFHRAPASGSAQAPQGMMMPSEAAPVGASVARARRVVLVPAVDMRGRETFELIPGVHLLDKDGILRFDAAGPAPRHALRKTVLPALADYAARLSSAAGRYHIEWSDPKGEATAPGGSGPKP